MLIDLWYNLDFNWLIFGYGKSSCCLDSKRWLMERVI